MSSDGTFAEATALRPRSGAATGVFEIDLDPGWAIADKPNGGYLTSVLAGAAVEAARQAASTSAAHRHPLAVSTHFLRAPDPGPAVVTAEVLRVGRGATQLAVRLSQPSPSPDGAGPGSVSGGGAERLCVTALVTLGTLTDEAAWWDDVPAPDLPPPEACLLLPDVGPGGARIHLMRHVLERLDPQTLRWGAGEPSGDGELRGYAELADGSPWSPLSLLTALDCFPPVTFDLGAMGWVPTLELTCYLRALPAPGPVVIRQAGGVVRGGRIDETCQIWDSTGALVASATQLAGVRVPPAPVRPGRSRRSPAVDPAG